MNARHVLEQRDRARLRAAQRRLKAVIKVGDTVSPKVPTEAWREYTDKGRPIVITPDMVGIVASVDVPSVRREGVSFCNVDVTHRHDMDPYNRQTVRVSLLYDNIVRS